MLAGITAGYQSTEKSLLGLLFGDNVIITVHLTFECDENGCVLRSSAAAPAVSKFIYLIRPVRIQHRVHCSVICPRTRWPARSVVRVSDHAMCCISAYRSSNAADVYRSVGAKHLADCNTTDQRDERLRGIVLKLDISMVEQLSRDGCKFLSRTA